MGANRSGHHSRIGSLLAETWTLVALAATLAILTLLFLRMVYPYVLPIFLAAVLAVILRPQYRQLAAWLGNRERIAALLTVLLSVVAVVVPLVLATSIVALRLYVFWLDAQAARSGAEMVNRIAHNLGVDELVEKLEEKTGRDVTSLWQDVQANVPDVVNWLAGRTLGVATATFGVIGGVASLVVAFFVFLFALYYFLAEGPGLLERASRLLPLPIEYQLRLFDAFTSTVRGAVVAMFVGAIAQGGALGLALWLVGVPKAGLLTILSVLSGFVPFVGTGLVWVPAVLWLWLKVSAVRALILALYSAVVVAGIDNVIRAYLMRDTARLHPLLALISILGGIAYFGLWGIFVGPIVASCLYATADVLKLELARLSGQDQHSSPAALKGAAIGGAGSEPMQKNRTANQEPDEGSQMKVEGKQHPAGPGDPADRGDKRRPGE